MDNLKIKIKNAPLKPGVYVFKNKNRIIYVGKAKILKKRVSSYFTKKHTDTKTAALVRKIDDVDYMVCGNEVEALILESNLIKKYLPKYNILFRDDKSYPYLAVTSSNDFARLTITREAHKAGTAYFGPYTNVRAVRQTLDTLRKIFPLRTCRGEKPGRKGSTPCLNFHIKRCLGPCTGNVSKEEYRELVSQVLLFLEGKGDLVIKDIKKKMKKQAKDLNFEEAARYRNRLAAAEQIMSGQKIVWEASDDIDILGIAQSEGYISVTVFAVRSGKLLASENFNLDKGLEADPLESFIKQYYLKSSFTPKIIYISENIEESKPVEAWLLKSLEKKVTIKVSQRGKKKRLVKMAKENADYSLNIFLKSREIETKNALIAARRLEEITGLKEIKRIECFDVSNISGSNATASMVVFLNGKPSPADYRKFKIRRVSGIDDYAMIKEVLERRLVKVKSQKSRVKSEKDSFDCLPDLIVIDGGRGHLGVAQKTLRTLKLDIKAISIAKKEEEIYIEGRARPLTFLEDDPGLNLVIRIRDEAHRSAVTYHRKLRSKGLKESVLDEIEGIGDQRKKAILATFGSVEAVKKASAEDLEKVPGVSKVKAKAIHEKLQKRA